MLRRKLLLTLGPVVIGVFATGVAMTALLQGVLADLSHLGSDVAIGSRLGTTLVERATDLELMLWGHEDASEAFASTFVARVQELIDRHESLERELGPQTMGLGTLAHISGLLGRLSQFGDAANTAGLEGEAGAGLEGARDVAGQLRKAITRLAAQMQFHVGEAQRQVLTRFRRVVLVLTLAFVVLVSVSLVMLARAARMVVGPVRELVEAARRLGREDYQTTVVETRHDEFDELACAFNDLAEHLRLNEQRKVETLRQVALAISHELNNSLNVLELQLDLLARRSGGGSDLGEPLTHVRETLAKMTRTVAALGRARRIVLTDYILGIKMLDIERSSEDRPEEQGQATTGPALRSSAS